MESWRKTSLVLPTPPVAYSGTIRFTCSGTMRIRENEQHYKSKTPDPTYLPTITLSFLYTKLGSDFRGKYKTLKSQKPLSF